MWTLLVISHDTSIRIAEVGFLLVLIAGVWLIAAEFVNPRNPMPWRRFRMVVAGALLAVAGLLLLIAVHWGSFR